MKIYIFVNEKSADSNCILPFWQLFLELRFLFCWITEKSDRLKTHCHLEHNLMTIELQKEITLWKHFLIDTSLRERTFCGGSSFCQSKIFLMESSHKGVPAYDIIMKLRILNRAVSF